MAVKIIPFHTSPFEGAVVLTRPLHELKDYFTHLEVPSIYYLIRLVKTCVMSIFRWHLYDVDHVLVGTSTGHYMHSFDGPLKSEAPSEFRGSHHFVLEHAVLLQPKREDEMKDQFSFDIVQGSLQPLTLSKVVTYLKDVLKMEGFPEKSKDPLFDLWNHDKFQVSYFGPSI